MVATAVASGVLAIGAAAPARTSPPTIWSTAAAGAPLARPAVVHWPRRPARRYAMDTPAGDRATDRPEQEQHGPDHQQDDADRGQDGNVQEQPQDEQDDAQDDHIVLRLLEPG